MQSNSTAFPVPSKPAKPTPDFPLFAHATKRWAKKIKGKMHYFGPWDDPQAALEKYKDFLAGKVEKRKPKHDKPAKPYDEFPLFAHASGRWAKKIRGQFKYFGPWDDPDGALAKYLDQKDALHAGFTPRDDTDELTIKDLANGFLNAKQSAVESHELSHFTFYDYKIATDLMIEAFGKRRPVADLAPADFAKMRRTMTKTKKWGLHRVGKIIQCVRTVFKFGTDNGLIKTPVPFGSEFKRASKKAFRVAKASQEAKLFTAEEINLMTEAATPSMKAMIMLGINCAFGNADCGTLPMRAIDLETGWVNFPRPKTGMDRRCPLWPETVTALREWLAVRPEPKGETQADLVFVTAKGGSWMKETSDNPVSKETAKLLKELKINGHRNFYTLRHTHRTIGDAACDSRASAFIMGHIDASMASHYVERIADERLRKVSDCVRTWLYAKPKKGE